MKSGDIDIDVGSRDELLTLIRHVPASMRNVKPIRRHSTGIYPTDIPYDPVHNMAAIDYEEAERRGYLKIDILNVYVYTMVKSELHLVELMSKEPRWDRLRDREFVSKLIHLGNNYHIISSMPEPINSIPRLAMALAIIRPSKKHLIGLPWAEVAKSIWEKDEDGEYGFKKAHAIAYAHLVVVHLNLLGECFDKTGTYDLGQLSP